MKPDSKKTKEIMKTLGYKNVMQTPKISKVSVNSGIGAIKDSRDLVEAFSADLALITGQKVSPRKARLSEAGFKIRKGDVVGLGVTLRGPAMWAFLEKLVAVVLPRSKGFWGLDKKSFDGSGNYSLGIKEHTVFPEINPNNVKSIRPLQVTITTTAKSLKETYDYLKILGLPFRE